ncbi:MAG: hypothetical protein ABSF71_26905 [Terriglobia bacterium]
MRQSRSQRRGMAILAMTAHGRDAPATAGETPTLRSRVAILAMI